MTTRTTSNDCGHDEETPLLPADKIKSKAPTPLPWSQLSVILFLQLAEPLTSQVIYPFAPQLIREVGITNGDETKVGYYVGILQSAFFAAQAITVLQWSRLSDIVGRKPVLIMGLFGISFSMYCFGLSRTYWGLVISRSLNGALNGNIGVMKSMMAEMTDSTNVAQAFAFMPIAWSTGGTLGPLIGGTLSKPAERFPGLFGSSQFFKDFPYFLACAIPATYALIALTTSVFFLKETVPSKTSISTLLGLRKTPTALPSQKPNASRNSSVSSRDTLVDPTEEKALPLRALLTRRVLIATLNYAMLSLVDICFRGIQPLFYATSIPLGGLGLSPAAIGACLSALGILNGLFQVFCFARIHARFGGRTLFVASVMCGFPIFAMFPVMSALAKHAGRTTPGVWMAVGAQVVLYTFFSMAYSSVFIFIAAASPNRRSIGATNGIAQMSVSITRTIGPSFANSLFSLSMKHGYLGGWLVWWALLSLVFLALAAGMLLPKKVWKREGED